VSEPGKPEPCTLIFGVLLSRDVPLEEVLFRVAERFGPVSAVAEERPFDHSSYYRREMGDGLRRTYAAVAGVVEPERLASLKLEANALEERWRGEGQRKVNLDPGLLNLNQVVLASVKPSGHRVYLGQGVYAEVEYVFVGGTFKAVSWTYADYRDPGVIQYFNGLRESLRVARQSPTAAGGAGP
jgi:hypothetical protein